MENLLQQLLGILVNPPGNLIYHLTLAFSIFASLQTALINRRSGESSGRVLLGLNLILIAQLALFLSSGLAWQNIVSAHIFLPEQLPTLYSDRDAIFQITNLLLQNAAQVTPIEGIISLRGHHQQDGSLEFIVLQVTDNGGGIMPNDLPRVFTQRLRSDGTPIPGIAENGVGLTVTKTLVDAVGGRIWVDSEVGLTSTFTVLLPIRTSGAQEFSGQ